MRASNRRGNEAETAIRSWTMGLRLAVSVLLLAAATIGSSASLAQLPDISKMPANPPPQPQLTMFPHPPSRYWISGQANFVYQTNPPFDAEYSGPHSFDSAYDKASGRVMTLYTGYQLTKSIEVLCDLEESEGAGISDALGLAGYVNLDATKDPTLSQAPYLSRIVYHQVFSFSNDTVDGNRGPLSTFSRLPTRRLELRVGKFAITDYFDTNTFGSDSHLQFLNWAIDQNGAYDFTADARGYTWGVHAEYQSALWGARFAEVLLPGPENGGPLVWDLRKANSSNAEFELHRGPLHKKDGMIRLLGYVNNGNMGIYKDAIQQYLDGKTPKPDIDNHPFKVTTKYGFGLNFEQPINTNVGFYGRFGWNNGKTESWSFTEIDQTFSSGVVSTGNVWKRTADRAGVAFASNAISHVHAEYLALGGLGFLLGDGRLRYARENLIEGFYTAHVWRGLYVAPDLQYIVNPGYNQDRGPVLVPGFRVHVEF